MSREAAADPGAPHLGPTLARHICGRRGCWDSWAAGDRPTRPSCGARRDPAASVRAQSLLQGRGETAAIARVPWCGERTSHPRHRDLLRRDRRGGGARPRAARRRHRLLHGRARPLRRHRPRGGLARPPRGVRAHDRRRPRGGRGGPRRRRRHRRHRRAGPGRAPSPSASPAPRPWRWPPASRCTASTTSSATPPSTSSSTAPSPTGSSPWSSRAATPPCCSWTTSPPASPSSGRPSTTPRGRRSTRSGACWGCPTPAARTSTGSPSRATPEAIRFPRGLSTGKDKVRHPYDFSFSGLKTAVARYVEGCEDRGEPVPGGRRRRRVLRVRRRRPHRQGAGRLPVPRLRHPRRRRRLLRELPAARAGRRAGGAARHHGAHPADPVLHRQRRDDRRARLRAGARGRGAVVPRPAHRLGHAAGDRARLTLRRGSGRVGGDRGRRAELFGQPTLWRRDHEPDRPLVAPPGAAPGRPPPRPVPATAGSSCPTPRSACSWRRSTRRSCSSPCRTSSAASASTRSRRGTPATCSG